MHFITAKYCSHSTQTTCQAKARPPFQKTVGTRTTVMRMIVGGTKTTTGSPSRSYRILIMINYHPSFNDFDDEGRASQFNNNDDPEYFAYECLSVASVEKIFNESFETVRTELGVSHSRAKQLLHSNKWSIDEILAKHAPAPSPPPAPRPSHTSPLQQLYCSVCALHLPETQFTSPKGCQHSFCSQCWEMHCETQISLGVSTSLSCMAPSCEVLCGEDLVLSQVNLNC